MSTIEIGIVGAGRMGRGIARRLAAAGNSVVVYDRDGTAAHAAAESAGDVVPPTTSGAEELARAVPDSTIVKAFNTNLAVTLPTAEIAGEQLDTFVACDNQHVRAAIIAALAGSGLRALDAGALSNSRTLEAMAVLGIEIGERYGLGQAFGFKYLPAGPLTPKLDSKAARATFAPQPQLNGNRPQSTAATRGESETRS